MSAWTAKMRYSLSVSVAVLSFHTKKPTEATVITSVSTAMTISTPNGSAKLDPSRPAKREKKQKRKSMQINYYYFIV